MRIDTVDKAIEIANKVANFYSHYWPVASDKSTEAQDLRQEAAVKAVEVFGDKGPISRVKLAKAIANHLYNYIRDCCCIVSGARDVQTVGELNLAIAREQEKLDEELMDVIDMLVSRSPTPLEQVEMDEQRLKIREAVEKLPWWHFVVMTAYLGNEDTAGKTMTEIADMLDLTVGRVSQIVMESEAFIKDYVKRAL